MSGPAFSFPSHVYFHDVDGQKVLLNMQTEEYFGLDEVGTNILNRLITMPEEKALDELSERYDVDSQTLRKDVDELVEQLIAEGLLMRVEPG